MAYLVMGGTGSYNDYCSYSTGFGRILCCRYNEYLASILDGMVPQEKCLRSCLLVVAILSESQSCSGRIDKRHFAVTSGNVVPFR
jgi:hypothetical protein